MPLSQSIWDKWVAKPTTSFLDTLFPVTTMSAEALWYYMYEASALQPVISKPTATYGIYSTAHGTSGAQAVINGNYVVPVLPSIASLESVVRIRFETQCTNNYAYLGVVCQTGNISGSAPNRYYGGYWWVYFDCYDGVVFVDYGNSNTEGDGLTGSNMSVSYQSAALTGFTAGTQHVLDFQIFLIKSATATMMRIITSIDGVAKDASPYFFDAAYDVYNQVWTYGMRSFVAARGVTAPSTESFVCLNSLSIARTVT